MFPQLAATLYFVVRQVVVLVVIRAAKLEFVAESRTRVYFAKHVAQLETLYFVLRQVGHKRDNRHNRGFQVAMQH